MDALQRLDAFAAAQTAGRALRCEAGLPVEVRSGAALCSYAWVAGELTRIVEADGRRHDYHHGDDGRLSRVDRDGVVDAMYRYDAAGRLVAVERQANPLAHDYDAQGRLVRTRRGDASPWLYRWDAQRVVEARCDLESSRFEHDANGRLVGISQRVDGIELSMQLSFDAADRLAAIDFPQWQQRIGFEWDPRGRPLAVAWNGETVARLGTDDAERSSWLEGADGTRSQTWHEAASGRALRQVFSGVDGQVLHEITLERDEQFRLVREGGREHAYDPQGRLIASGDQRYRHDASDNVETDAAFRFDRLDNIASLHTPAGEKAFRYNQAHELESVLVDGECVARCRYDHKGRLLLKTTAAGTERYLYGPDDALLAVADGQGRPSLIVLRLPTGIVGTVDFRLDPQGKATPLHCDHGGNLVHVAGHGPLTYDAFGLPLQADPGVTPIFRSRFWHAELGLYRIGCRWYDPSLRRYLTPDTHTGAPDDARLVNPFVPAHEQRMMRVRLLADWLREPRLRNRYAYCANDPVNRFDPDGHWSFGGVLLSLLGVLWTLPNTVFGLAIEVTCLIGEVIRWLVYAFTAGNVSWQTPGFDVASSSHLDAFALVFKGGWFGSFKHLLGITFGNVIFVNGEYEQAASFQALPDPTIPTAYDGKVTIPKSQALYEHELRHVDQYGWFGPFFHLGLPIFGVYEWDVILNGYQNASLEADARAHAGY